MIFLAEAFTRPAMMQTLGKIGFAQSYTYFTWKNTRWELLEFMGQLLEWRDYYRPNCFVNTPDILHEYLVRGGPPAFEARLVLAATLSPSYGIYSGFESFENVPVREGSEEYLDSEKYEVKQRALDGPLLPLVAKLNAAQARQRGAAAPRQRHVPRDGERTTLRLLEAHGRQCRPGRRQSRSDRAAGRRLRPAGVDRSRADVSRARPARRRGVVVAHRPQLRPARRRARATS